MRGEDLTTILIELAARAYNLVATLLLGLAILVTSTLLIIVNAVQWLFNLVINFVCHEPPSPGPTEPQQQTEPVKVE